MPQDRQGDASSCSSSWPSQCASIEPGPKLAPGEVDELGGEAVGHGAVKAVVEDAALDHVHLARAPAGELAAGCSLEENRQQVLAGLGSEEELLEVRNGQAGRRVGEHQVQGAVTKRGLCARLDVRHPRPEQQWV